MVVLLWTTESLSQVAYENLFLTVFTGHMRVSLPWWMQSNIFGGLGCIVILYNSVKIVLNVRKLVRISKLTLRLIRPSLYLFYLVLMRSSSSNMRVLFSCCNADFNGSSGVVPGRIQSSLWISLYLIFAMKVSLTTSFSCSIEQPNRASCPVRRK